MGLFPMAVRHFGLPVFSSYMPSLFPNSDNLYKGNIKIKDVSVLVEDERIKEWAYIAKVSFQIQSNDRN
jgi:hypothetical protein